MNDNCNVEFDTYLGGSQSVPGSLNISEFVKTRMEEVVMLTETIKESPFRGQTFQRLPKQMRRRQMSHYLKRLPRRLQNSYLLSLKDGMPAPTKRPSRKYRRRPFNLLSEYNRRQKRNVWLETHIWHAKRFHMVEKWGYKLAEKSVNKTYRACYRALSEHCLLTDISYYNCIELKGLEKELLNGLQQCTSPECGLTFAAKMYLNGSREGSTFLFHPNAYPYQVIGNVTFMWKPINPLEKERQIWIWVHPLIHAETVQCFQKLFDLSAENVTSNGVQANEIQEPVENDFKSKHKRKKCKQDEKMKLKPKNVPFDRVPKFKNCNATITMSLLKDTLNRFQLLGPLSQAIISQTFDIASISSSAKSCTDIKIVEVVSKSKKQKLDEVDNTNKEDVVCKKWWLDYYKEDFHKKNWENQKCFYEEISNYPKPDDLSSQMILSVVVEDPRLKIPSKREKVVPKDQEYIQLLMNSVDKRLCQSPIWNPEIRNEVSETKISNHELNEIRSKKIVPGSDVKELIPEEKKSRIPILLVQRPGRTDSKSGKLGLGSGWDIISPAGFGMPIWLSLIFRGARVGGLREQDLIHLECHNLNDNLQPDSAAGETNSQSNLQQLKKRYFSLPPNKRANFIKLGVRSPFYCPWKLLVKNWNKAEKSEEFCVLRNKKILLELREIVEKFPKVQNLNVMSSLDFKFLIPIEINCLGRGTVVNMAMICLPNKEDFNQKAGPQEPVHNDENESLRKILQTEHKQLLKSLKRKRKKDRRKLKESFANNLANNLKWKNILKFNSAPSEPHSEEYNSKMKLLWVPDHENINTIADSCSRKILGFVVKGGFSFSSAGSVALGYVTLPGLIELLTLCKENKSKPLVLIRNRNQRQYRFGKLGISIE